MKRFQKMIVQNLAQCFSKWPKSTPRERFEWQGGENNTGAMGGRNNTKGTKIINHKSIIELASVAYCYALLVSCKF